MISSGNSYEIRKKLVAQNSGSVDNKGCSSNPHSLNSLPRSAEIRHASPASHNTMTNPIRYDGDLSLALGLLQCLHVLDFYQQSTNGCWHTWQQEGIN